MYLVSCPKRFSFRPYFLAFCTAAIKLHVPKVPVIFAGYLLELQEHANFNGGRPNAKIAAEKKTFSLDRIEKQFGQVTKYIIPSEK